jgi:hypothetical protein
MPIAINECSRSDIELITSRCNSYSTDDFGRFPSHLQNEQKNGKDDGECHVTFPVRRVAQCARMLKPLNNLRPYKLLKKNKSKLAKARDPM